MQNTPWMQSALQEDEAVLLPAMERSIPAPPRQQRRTYLTPPPTEGFIPVEHSWEQTKPASHTNASARTGSIAGRSILRAVQPCRPHRKRRSYP